MRPNRLAKFSAVLVLMTAQLVCGFGATPPAGPTPAPTAAPAVVPTTPPPPAAPTPAPTTPPSLTQAASPTEAPATLTATLTPTATVNALFEKANLLSGKWAGKWNNLTFATTGTEEAVISPNADGTATLSLQLTGHVLGVGAPPPVTYTGTYDANGYLFTAKGDQLFGNLKIAIGYDGQVTVTADVLPVPGLARLTAQGTMVNQQGQFTYTVFFAGGATAKGTAALTQTPSAAPSGIDPRLQTFVDSFVPALRTNDTTFLFQHLHPAVLKLYGAAQCQDYMSKRGVDPTYNIVILGVQGPAPWDWVASGISTPVQDVYTLDANVTTQGKTDRRPIHLALVNNTFAWFTVCGNPLVTATPSK